MFSSPGSIAFSIGSFDVRWYGILIALGIVAAYAYAVSEARRRGYDANALSDAVVWIVIAGIFGARLYYVAFQWSYYSTHLGEIFAVWRGGLAIHGALLGGLIAFLLFMRRKRLPFLAYVDMLIPGVLFAQAIGRFGNFFNNEAFGAPTDLPWALFIPREFRPQGFEDVEAFHPTFLYESLWNLLVFATLVALSRQWFGSQKSEKAAPGSVAAAYLILYSAGRFVIEGLRLDSLYLGPLRIAQVVSLTLIILGAAFFIVRGRAWRRSRRGLSEDGR